MSTIKLIVFDLDGVLVDTKNIHFNALNSALKKSKINYQISYEEHLKIFDGLTTKEKLQILLKKRVLKNKNFKQIIKFKNIYTDFELSKNIKFNSKIYNIFKKLSKKYKIIVATNAIKKTLDTCIKKLKIKKFLSLSYSNQDVLFPKPHPQIYLKCMVDGGSKPKETLIIEDSEKFGFVASEFTELAIMDSDISTKIDSGLISATIDMNLNNQLPFSGDLLMYISNNPDYFPFCIDSLITGSLDEQEVSDSCKTYINDYLGCENLSVLEIYPNTDSSFVKHLDCITINNENHYYENLLNIEFLPPTLDDWGNVLDSVLSQQEIILDDEIYYFTKDTLQYLIPRFVFDSDLETITLQPNNSLNVNSSIMFKLLSTGLLE